MARAQSSPVMSPKEVMCFLYGDKGAHLLALKKKQKETLDSHESISATEASPDETCPAGITPHLAHPDPQFADANAQYLATESLWPATYPPGGVADGLIYLKEPASLPVTLHAGYRRASVDGQARHSQSAATKQMTHAQLTAFFEAQKRGNSFA